MKPKQNNLFQQLQLFLPNLNSVLFLILLAWALGTLGLGWLFKSILVVVAILLLLPIVAVVVAQWWVKKNVVTGACPSCGVELTGVNSMALVCPNCRDRIEVADGRFARYREPGTVDVDVVDATNVTVLPPDPDDER